MKSKYSCPITILVLLAVLVLPLFLARAAGGRIEGKVTDPKGAAIAGATIRVIDPANNQTFTATTDNQGNYKVEGLAAGTYTVVVSAKGFGDGRVETVKLDEGAVVPVNLKLELAAVEAEVNVTTSGPKPNADPVYQQLRQIAKQESPASYATVNNLVLKRDAATFTLKSGEIYFLTQVEGRYVAAVFIGEGEMKLVPPTDAEKRSLQVFTDEPGITEEFSHLVLRFTDKTFEEVKNSPNAKLGSTGPQADRARDLYRENGQLLKHTLRDNRDLRTLVDLYCSGCPGYFNAFIDGKKHNKLVYLLDPLGIPFVSPEEVVLLSYGQTDGGLWTAFHLADEYQKGTASSAEDHRLVDMTHHEIDATIKGARLTATDRITFRALTSGIRVVPMDLFATLRVSRIEDEQGRDLNFIQENKDEDADFGIIFPQALEAGKTYKVTVHYGGNDALRDSGGGN
ncbi:MAG TPA: carboxypeptidase regulatory-like domain-containing protein, partial [Pyrinomonadaceae bacterium]|nr:carboxypeptidase regulatory-like domain-containing protein [Pyrinomonadaceae bacterium]